MRKKKMARSLAAALYDNQITGKGFLAIKKSFLEVAQFLQKDRKK